MHPRPMPIPPLPSPAFVAMARAVAGNPAAYAHLSNFTELRHTAWSVLMCAQLARHDARRPVVLPTIGPGDAA